MRSFLLVLMIALLPLRMWAAEGMSAQMAAASVGTASAQAPAMPADCPMMAGANQGDPSGDTLDGKDSGRACASCQLCGAVALPARFETAPAIGPRILAPPITSSFRSAPPLLADKPPIS